MDRETETSDRPPRPTVVPIWCREVARIAAAVARLERRLATVLGRPVTFRAGRRLSSDSYRFPASTRCLRHRR